MAKKLKSGVMKPKPPLTPPPWSPLYNRTQGPSPVEDIADRLAYLFCGCKQYSVDKLYKVFEEEIQGYDRRSSYTDKHFHAALDKLVKDKGVVRKDHPIFGTVYLKYTSPIVVNMRVRNGQAVYLPTSKMAAAERLRSRIGRVGVCQRCGGSMLGKGRHSRSKRHTQAECDEQMVKRILTI
jgi:hypothetical protein